MSPFFVPSGDLDVPEGFSKNGDTLADFSFDEVKSLTLERYEEAISYLNDRMRLLDVQEKLKATRVNINRRVKKLVAEEALLLKKINERNKTLTLQQEAEVDIFKFFSDASTKFLSTMGDAFSIMSDNSSVADAGPLNEASSQARVRGSIAFGAQSMSSLVAGLSDSMFSSRAPRNALSRLNGPVSSAEAAQDDTDNDQKMDCEIQ